MLFLAPVFGGSFFVPYERLEWNVPKMSMAENDVFTYMMNSYFVIKLQRENTLKRKQLSSTNHKSSFQSRARHFLAWNRTVF